MEIAIKRYPREALSEAGILLCEITASLPYAEGDGKEAAAVNRFYEAVRRGVYLLGQKAVLPPALARYEKNDDPRRRFTHRPYLVSVEAHMLSQGGYVGITRTLTLCHRGRILVRKTVEERILPGGQILPGALKPRTKKRQNAGIRKGDAP